MNTKSDPKLKEARMRLLKIEQEGPRAFIGFIEDENEYKEFYCAEGEELVVRAAYPRKEYEGYEFFAAVMGRFDLHTTFLARPVPLKELSYKALQEACRLLPYGYL